jgi:predicted permease
MGFADLWLRIRALARRRSAERDLDDEVNFHLEMEARKNRLAGLPEAEARRAARVGFGGVERAREECRDARGVAFLQNLARDLRYGWRVLLKAPLFTAISILSLAMGIGANTAIFSLVDTVLLRMLPVRSPEQLAILKWSANEQPGALYFYANSSRKDGQGRFQINVFSWDIFAEVRSHSRTLSDAFGFSHVGQLNVTANGEPRVAGGLLVAGNYFSGLGVHALLGRPIVADDDTVDGVPAAVVSYRFWERAFGLDRAAIGKTIYINRQPSVVVGVTPREFFGVSAGGFVATPEVDVTLPIRFRDRFGWVSRTPTPFFAPDRFWIQMMGRVKPASDERAVRAELTAILTGHMPEAILRNPLTGAVRIEFEAGSQGLDYLRQRYRQPLLILMTVVGLTLLMACANLAGLLMARATARRKEITLRLALGAGRWRLVWQLLVEGALLSLGGAAAGVLLAFWGVHALLAMVSSGPVAILLQVHPDARILGFTAAISLLTTLLFGLAPALRATRLDLAQGMKEDTPLERGNRRFGPVRTLVTAQIAVALLLLAGATLFTRSLANLRAIPLGFNPKNLVLFGLAPGRSGYDEVRGYQLYERVLERLNRMPRVIGASLSTDTPISGFGDGGAIRVEGGDSKKAAGTMINDIGPNFFDVMRIPLVLGRAIDQRDMGSASKVAVINETCARRYFGAGSPIGKRFRWRGGPDWEIQVVGVVRDAKYQELRGDSPPTVYVPYTQSQRGGWLQQMDFEVRAAGDPAAAVAAIRAAVREVDRTLPLLDVKTMEGQIDEALAQERLFASLVTLFGAIALALACVGLYGLVSYSVASRTREIGLRMALGADRLGVLRMILGQVAITTAAGLTVGVPATLALTRIVESQLYGIEAHDPLSILAAAAGVTVVAMLAAFFPARRAMHIDPVRALRYE